MDEVVITGAGGFVGKSLAPFLEKMGFKVLRLSLRNSDWKKKVPRDAFAIIHLAGLAHDLKNTNQPEEYYRINTDLTCELFDFFLGSNAAKFIFLSSVKAAADVLGSNILIEDHAPHPATPYGKSKLKAEQHILSKHAGNKGVYILRPSMIHGPGNKGNLNQLYKLVSSGIPYPFASFENSRSFLSIDNLNFIINGLCSRDIPSGVYNISDSEYLSTMEVVDVINATLGKKSKSLHFNKALIRQIAKIGNALHLPFNEEKLNKLTESYMVSNQKLLRAIDRELPVSAKEGMILTFKSFSV